MTDDERDLHPLADPETSTAALRERVYATLVGLATVLTLLNYIGDSTPVGSAVQLAGSMVALFAASLVADVVAQSGTHGEFPRGRELRRAVAISAQILEITVGPVALIALAATGLWTLRTGLILAVCLFAATQVGVAVVAARRTRLSRRRRFVLILVEIGLGAAVVAIKLLTH